MKDESDWFVAIDKKPHGPKKMDDLVALFKSGSIDLGHKFWHKDLKAWQLGSELEPIAHFHSLALAQMKEDPRWMVVVDRKVNKDPVGPKSDNELEKDFLSGQLLDSSLFWKKGLDGWKTVNELPEIAKLKAGALLKKASQAPDVPPSLEEEDEIPEIPGSVSFFTSTSESESDGASSGLRLDSGELKLFSETLVPTWQKGDPVQDVVLDRVMALFEGSRWLAAAEAHAMEVVRGINSGDPVLLGVSANNLNKFLASESQPAKKSRHPGWTDEKERDAFEAIFLALQDPTVNQRMGSLNPAFSAGRPLPSSVAFRAKVLFGLEG